MLVEKVLMSKNLNSVIEGSYCLTLMLKIPTMTHFLRNDLEVLIGELIEEVLLKMKMLGEREDEIDHCTLTWFF